MIILLKLKITDNLYYDCTNYYFEINYNDTDLVDEEGNIIEKGYISEIVTDDDGKPDTFRQMIFEGTQFKGYEKKNVDFSRKYLTLSEIKKNFHFIKRRLDSLQTKNEQSLLR